MIDRREMLIGSGLCLVAASSKIDIGKGTDQALGDFVSSETLAPLSPYIERYLQWEVASGRGFAVFSPDRTRVLTWRKPNDFATVFNVETAAELEVVRPFKIVPNGWLAPDGTRRWTTWPDHL